MYDIVLLERQIEDGLTRAEIMDMLDSMSIDEVAFLEFDNPAGNSTAAGFITMPAYESINYDTENLAQFVGNILNDVEEENELGIHSFQNTPDSYKLKLFLSRNID